MSQIVGAVERLLKEMLDPRRREGQDHSHRLRALVAEVAHAADRDIHEVTGPCGRARKGESDSDGADRPVDEEDPLPGELLS